MRKTFKALVADLDHTLSDTPGSISREVSMSLWRLRKERKKIIIASGRELAILRSMISFAWADMIVAENGGIIFDLHNNKEYFLGEKENEVCSVFRKMEHPEVNVRQTIVSLPRKYEEWAKKIVVQNHLKAKMRHNRWDLLIMPPEIDKGQGVKKALGLLNILPEFAAYIGDAENDLDLFQLPGFKVAVANAVEELKNRADLVTSHPNGKGVVEFINSYLPR